MSELSQAERTAMGEAFHAYDASSIGLPPTNSFSAAWSLGRDYGRERERTLTEALSRLLNASRDIMPYEKKGPVNDLIEAEAHADEVLAASPGEPEGQCEHEFQMHPQSEDFGVCSLCGESQPDHGPGEPEITDEMIEGGVAEVDRMHAEDQMGFPGTPHTWVQRVLKAAHGLGEPSGAKIERVAKAITMYQTGDSQRIGEGSESAGS